MNRQGCSLNKPRIYQSAKGFTLDNEHRREFISLTQEFILWRSHGLSNELSAIVRAPFDPQIVPNSVDDPNKTVNHEHNTWGSYQLVSEPGFYELGLPIL